MEAITENYFFVSIAGNGTNTPVSGVYGGANGKTLASASTVTAAEVIGLYHSIKSQYRDNLAFVATGTTLGIIRSLAASYAFSFINTPSGSLNVGTGAGGDYIISPNCRVYESDEIADFGASTRPILIGNFNEYLIGERQALSVFRDPYSSAANGVVNFHCLFRRGGNIVTNEAFKYALCPTA
jgi:HK97 family phage major capsid protein